MELRYKGEEYKQQEADVDSCVGCSFNDSKNRECELVRGLGGLHPSTDICNDNQTIWIKVNNEQEVDNFMSNLKERTAELSTEESTGVKHDQEKERYDLIPVLALEEVAKVLTVGSHKYNTSYDDENWRKVPFAELRYLSAIQRHIAWVRKGQSYDSETNLHHYAHAISSLMFLLEKELELKAEQNKC